MKRAKRSAAVDKCATLQVSALSGTARVQTNAKRLCDTGSRSRLPPRSVLLCFAQRCPPDTRTLSPQPKRKASRKTCFSFWNDVCLTTNDVVSLMMALTLMMCGFATFYGKHRISANVTSNLIMHSITSYQLKVDASLNGFCNF